MLLVLYRTRVLIYGYPGNSQSPLFLFFSKTAILDRNFQGPLDKTWNMGDFVIYINLGYVSRWGHRIGDDFQPTGFLVKNIGCSAHVALINVIGRTKYLSAGVIFLLRKPPIFSPKNLPLNPTPKRTLYIKKSYKCTIQWSNSPKKRNEMAEMR